MKGKGRNTSAGIVEGTRAAMRLLASLANRAGSEGQAQAVRRTLFESAEGQTTLAVLEQKLGLAIVPAAFVEQTRVGR